MKDMKIKLGTILLIIAVLIFGIIIGSNNNVGTSNYFEETKNEFEDTITTPNNSYQPKNTQVEGNVFSKVAVKIDEKINDLIQAVLDKIV